MFRSTLAALAAVAIGLVVLTGSALDKKPERSGSCLGLTATIVGSKGADMAGSTEAPASTRSTVVAAVTPA